MLEPLDVIATLHNLQCEKDIFCLKKLDLYALFISVKTEALIYVSLAIVPHSYAWTAYVALGLTIRQRCELGR